MPTSGIAGNGISYLSSTLQVEHRVLPVFLLGLVFRNEEAGIAGDGFDLALRGDEVLRDVPELLGRLEQHAGEEQEAGADLLGMSGLSARSIFG